MVVAGLQEVHDCRMDLVGRERFTGLLELRMSLGASRPPQLLGRQWLAHREPSVSATDDHRQTASWTGRWKPRALVGANLEKIEEAHRLCSFSCLDIGLVSHLIPIGWHRIRFPRAGFLSGTWGNIFSKIPARGFFTFSTFGRCDVSASRRRVWNTCATC